MEDALLLDCRSIAMTSGAISACLAFRNSSPWLAEWLAFHEAAGIEHFYLYNNESTDAFHDVLAPYRDRDVLTLVDWPGFVQQNAIYEDCLKRSRTDGARWVAFIDDDEFLFSKDGRSLRETLAGYEAAAGVAVAWKLFGSSHQIYRKPAPVVERFTRRAASLDHHHKCIVQPALIAHCVTAGHYFEPLPGKSLVDQAHRTVTGAQQETPADGTLQLHHYITKSIQELVTRRTSRDIGYGNTPKLPLDTWIDLDRHWNEVVDEGALPTWERAKRRRA